MIHRLCDLEPLTEGLRRRASDMPGKPAVISAGQTPLTWKDLWEASAGAARALVDTGVAAGDRVVIAAESSAAFAVAYFATHLAHAVAVPVDAHSPPARVKQLVARVRPAVMIGGERISMDDLGTRVISLHRLVSHAGSEGPRGQPPIDALADLLFTSGTGGRSKGVMLSHGNISAAAQQINAVIQNKHSDVEVVPLPLNHSFGLTRLRCAVLTGTTLVLVSGFRLPGDLLAAIDQYRATGLVGVPAAFAILLRFGGGGLGSVAHQLRYVELGSAPMPLENKHALMQALPSTALWMHYGLTEASRSAFLEFHRDQKRLETVGRLTPGVEGELRPLDAHPDSGRQVLWLRGRSVAAGYWDDEELTAARFKGGWLNTGDIASRSDGGFITLHGRSDDVMNVGGYNVSPDEVEAVLATHPAVGEVACVAATDPRGISGTVVSAYLVARAGTAPPADRDLLRWAGDRLEHYKVPAIVQWVDSLPRTELGKLKRSALRAASPDRERL